MDKRLFQNKILKLTSVFLIAIVASLFIVKSTQALTTWNSYSTGLNAEGIAYGNGVFVAVGSSGAIRTSTDGISSWTARTSGTTQSFYGVVFANNIFVAVAQGGVIRTSSDGITWATQTSGTTLNFRGIRYLNGTFFAVGSGGLILTSSDGITWATQTSGTTEWLYDIAYANNTFVVVGTTGKILTSSDGITWTSQTSGVTNLLYGITYGNNLFVVTSEGKILTSSNGTSWAVRTYPSTQSVYDVAYVNNTFVAVGHSMIASSTDGISWTSRLSSAQTYNSIIYVNDTLFVVNSNSTIRTSSFPATYTLTFDSNGGSAVSSISATSGTTITPPANPTKTGYTFSAWSPTLPATMPAANQTHTAQWTANTYTVSYNANTATSGAAPSSQTKTYDVALTLATNSGSLAKTGYTFAGWNTAADGTGTNYATGASYTTNSALTLYAKWTINQYTLTFDTDGGSAVSAITQNYNTAITSPSNPTKSGYTFAGWSPIIPTNMPAANQTHTAQWTPNQYTLTFDSDGGSAVSPIMDDYNAVVNPPADPTKEGYSFAGWNPALPSNIPASDDTYTALWTINQYTLTFDSDGGSAVSAITDDYNAVVTPPVDPTKTGYTFAGWSPSLPSNIPASNETYTAQWTINQYTLTFDSDGGSAVSAITDDYNASVTPPADPTKEGYTFAGWNPALPSNIPASDETYTAIWTIDQFAITFDSDEGSTVDAIVDDFGATITAPADPTKTGYTFAGWSPALPSTMPASNNTYTAQWTPNEYTLSFDSDGGSAVSAITDDYNTSITPPSDPTKTGYTFAGWSPALPSTMPAGDQTHTAQWNINQYTLTFDSDGGSVVDAIMDDYNAAVTLPTDPTKTGYTFTGWSPSLPSTIPASNTSYTAQWDINQYTLTFNADGGSTVSAITDDYNTSVTAPADPTKTGYTFAGWNPALPSNIPAGNQTHTAIWTLGQFALTFNTDGGSIVNAIIDDFGATITSPADPTKTGYTFAGWSPTLPLTMPSSNQSYTALWTEVTSERKRTTSVPGRIQNLVQIGNIERATELSTQYNQPLPTSIDGLRSLLVQLQTKLQQLLSQQSSQQSPSSNIQTTNRDLELNDEGDDVRTLQQLLISKGYSISSGPTGFFGLQTQAALIKFQQDNGIVPAAGYYGPKTRAILN